MKTWRAGQLRRRLAREAARLMYEEGVAQYLDAKHMAARRIMGRQQGRKIRHRPHDLPSNGEIQDELLELAAMVEGGERFQRLLAMRIRALEMMQWLRPFSPRLIGSVSTGHARRGSDIDLHVFSDAPDLLERHLWQEGWDFERQTTTIRSGKNFKEYLHLHLQHDFPVELSVYETRELRIVQRSSTDGKPILRLSESRLRALLEEEHPMGWETYQASGEIHGLDALLHETKQMTLADLEARIEAEDF